MRRMYEIVEPTKEQREAIRAIVIEYIRETRLNPTPEQRREAARRIYQILDEEDRVKLFETIFAPL
jgi:hypothetical protein